VRAGLVFSTVFIVALLSRLLGLGDVLTADEERWMIRAGDFYRAIEGGDLAVTFQGTHPGVVPMLLAGGGIQAQELIRGERFRNEENVGQFRHAAKLPFAVATAALVGLVSLLATLLWGGTVGVLGGLLLALDPFLLGHSQIVHLDALLALLMLASTLAIVWFFERGARRALALSAFLGGFALLTKLPSIYLLPLLALALLLWKKRWRGETTPRTMVSLVLLWILIAFTTVVAVWPSMWRQLPWNLGFVKRDVITATTAPHFTETEFSSKDFLFYPRALLTRALPIVLILAPASVLFLLRRKSVALVQRSVLFLWVYAAGFLIMISLVAKRSDRYLLPGYVALVLLAGFSLGALWSLRRFPRSGKVLSVVIILGVLLQDVFLAPYALAYRNRLAPFHEYSQEGWGEGLETAAAFLGSHPLREQLDVATWYPNVFRHFFPGKTFSLSARDDPRVDYVILYRNMQGRSPDDPATEILGEYATRTPEHVVTVLGEPYAWVYRTESVDLYPSHVGEIRSGMEVGQIVLVERNGLAGVRLVFSTFSSRPNTVDVIVHVRESLDATDDLRTVRVNASELEDGAWRTFSFAPIPDSAGKTYYIAVTSPEGRAGNAVTVRFQERDIHLGHMVLLRRPLRDHERRDSFLRTGDIGYRLLYR